MHQLASEYAKEDQET